MFTNKSSGLHQWYVEFIYAPRLDEFFPPFRVCLLKLALFHVKVFDSSSNNFSVPTVAYTPRPLSITSGSDYVTFKIEVSSLVRYCYFFVALAVKLSN